MPRGLKRFQESKQSHFVTFSCYQRRPLLSSSARCDLFVEKLEQTRQRFSLRIYGFVVMPEHVHLLLSEPDRDHLADALHSLKLAVAKSVAAVERKPGRLWQARYYDRNVRDYEEFVEKLRYIHRNPVKRGLVKRPEDWKWSSFRHYATGESCGVEIESE
jgi:putative transposase